MGMSLYDDDSVMALIQILFLGFKKSTRLTWSHNTKEQETSCIGNGQYNQNL